MSDKTTCKKCGLEYTYARFKNHFCTASLPPKNRAERRARVFKKVRCLACNGTGYYDHNGSPKCSACNGTGG